MHSDGHEEGIYDGRCWDPRFAPTGAKSRGAKFSVAVWSHGSLIRQSVQA